jgi:hypothetical protein
MISPPDSLVHAANSGNLPDSVMVAPAIPVAEIGPPLPVPVFSKPETEEKLPNFFFTHYSKDLQPHPRYSDAEGWIVPSLLGAVFLLGIINTFYFKEVRIILMGIFKRSGISKLLEEENTMIRRSIVMMILLFLIVSPVFAYQISGLLQVQTAYLPYIPAYFQLLLLGAGSLGFKLLTINIIGNLFYAKEESGNYIIGIIVMNCILGVALIPVTLGIKLAPAPFNTWALYAGIALFIALYLYSLIIGWLAGLRNGTLSKFHLFLYFCTLEILPVFLIIKAVRNLI